TGHSKGGAMAQILANYVSELGFSKEQIEVITFGAPKVGNHAFTEYIMSKAQIKNIINEKDAIPALTFGNYKHVPSIFKIPTNLVEEAKKEGFNGFGGMVASHFMAYTFNYYPSKASRELLKRMNPIGFKAVYEVFE
ncbi:MAG: lipase family protein, partial [Streptococcaceae bacterium]|nr:lipase family protein [Streptococcaceae bacterium]